MNSRLTSQRSATIHEFLELFSRTLEEAWNSPKRKEVGVYEAYPIDLVENDHPPLLVTWSYIKEPNRDIGEIKPRERHRFRDPEDRMNVKVVRGQRFTCHVSFELWSYDQRLLNQRSEQFTDFMMSFTPFFMSQGVPQILFIREETIEPHRTWRESLYGRLHLYRVDIEKNVQFDIRTIEQITAKVLSQTGESLPDHTII